MKSLIVYYSYSGTTKKVAALLAGYLREKDEVELLELIPQDVSKNFFVQGWRAIKRVRAELAPVNFDVKGYDRICLGTPVWAFAPTPAMNTFLDKCTGLEGKEVVIFCTTGGTGIDKCLNYMQEILAAKGALSFKRFACAQNRVKDKEFVLGKFREVDL